MSKSYIYYIYYHDLIHDICAKVKFQIQIWYSCYSSNVDSVITASVEKINSKNIVREIKKKMHWKTSVDFWSNYSILKNWPKKKGILVLSSFKQ